MKIFWLGGVAEKNDFKKMQEKGNTQIAANITQLNYIEGIEETTNTSVKILNSNFEPAFPKYKEIFVKKRKWIRKGKENIDIGFINIPVFKYIHKTIKLKQEMRKIIKNELAKDELNIFFIYAMTSPLMLLAKFIKKHIKNKNYVICLIVPDLPEFMNMNRQNIIKNILLKYNRRIIYKSIKYIDKFVLFAEPMAEHLKVDPKDYIVIEGMTNATSKKLIEESIIKENYIMYAGGMNEKYGALNLVKAFTCLENKNIELWLYGIGDATKTIKELAKKDSRIKYKGIISNDQIINIEKKAKLLVNPRPTSEEYTKYSFPSKNMEYMLSGTPLLTTKLPAMPKEYYKYIYCIDDESINGIKKALIETLGKSEEELLEKGNEAKEFVLRQKNNIIQAQKIIDFLRRKITNEKI